METPNGRPAARRPQSQLRFFWRRGCPLSAPGCHRDRSADCATPTGHCLRAGGLGGARPLPQPLHPNSGEEEACSLCPLPARRSWGWTVVGRYTSSRLRIFVRAAAGSRRCLQTSQGARSAVADRRGRLPGARTRRRDSESGRTGGACAQMG